MTKFLRSLSVPGNYLNIHISCKRVVLQSVKLDKTEILYSCIWTSDCSGTATQNVFSIIITCVGSNRLAYTNLGQLLHYPRAKGNFSSSPGNATAAAPMGLPGPPQTVAQIWAAENCCDPEHCPPASSPPSPNPMHWPTVTREANATLCAGLPSFHSDINVLYYMFATVQGWIWIGSLVFEASFTVME